MKHALLLLNHMSTSGLPVFGRVLQQVFTWQLMCCLRALCMPCQVEAYSVMSEPIVDALHYFSALSFDILSFLIIERLAASGRPKLKDDGINISDWLQVHPAFLLSWPIIRGTECGSG